MSIYFSPFLSRGVSATRSVGEAASCFLWAVLHGIVSLVREKGLGAEVCVSDAMSMAARAVNAPVGGLH